LALKIPFEPQNEGVKKINLLDIYSANKSDHYRQGIEDLMAGYMHKKNMVLYEAKRTAA
jgi:hypothetical protein